MQVLEIMTISRVLFWNELANVRQNTSQRSLTKRLKPEIYSAARETWASELAAAVIIVSYWKVLLGSFSVPCEVLTRRERTLASHRNNPPLE